MAYYILKRWRACLATMEYVRRGGYTCASAPRRTAGSSPQAELSQDKHENCESRLSFLRGMLHADEEAAEMEVAKLKHGQTAKRKAMLS